MGSVEWGDVITLFVQALLAAMILGAGAFLIAS